MTDIALHAEDRGAINRKCFSPSWNFHKIDLRKKMSLKTAVSLEEKSEGTQFSDTMDKREGVR